MKAEVSMIERVARVVNPDLWAFIDSQSHDWADKHKHTARALDHARSVIEAMRKPTYPMEQAGWSALPRDAGPSDAAYIWEKMIDAALGAEREAV